MRQDVSTNRLAAIGTSKESVGAGIGLDLVRLPRPLALSSIIQLISVDLSKRRHYHQNANVEFLGHVCQL